MREFTPEQIASLEAKLDPKNVSEREQAGRKFQYIEGWHAIAEANRIFGFDAWDRETVKLEQVRPAELLSITDKWGKTKDQWRVGYMAKVRITVYAQDNSPTVRDGTGFGSGAMGDLGEAIESAIKEAETDAMKRAFMTFGNAFGLALYDKSRANVGYDEPAIETPNKAVAAPLVLGADYQAIYKSMRGNKTPDDLRAWWKDDECKTWRAKLTLPELDKLRAEFATFGSNLAARQEATQTPFDDETARINDELSKSPLGAG
jgi:DNA repair and recombination protein RAD52